MKMTDEEQAHEHDALARVQRCMFDLGREMRTLDVRGFHFWRRLAGGYSMEWTGGPDAADVLAELEEMAADDEWTTVLRPGDITEAKQLLDWSPGSVSFRVRGVMFQLRPVETGGSAEGRARSYGRIG